MLLFFLRGYLSASSSGVETIFCSFHARIYLGFVFTVITEARQTITCSVWAVNLRRVINEATVHLANDGLGLTDRADAEYPGNPRERQTWTVCQMFSSAVEGRGKT